MPRTRLTPEEYATVLQAADDWTRRRTLETGTFFLRDLQRFLDQHYGTSEPGRLKYESLAQRLIADLPNLGQIRASGGGRLAYARSGLVRPPHTLASLVECARGRVDPAKAAPKGRRTLRELKSITPNQLGDIERAAALAAEMIAGGRERLDAVGPEHFAWHPHVGERDRGEWALVLKIGEYSDETARRHHCAVQGDALAWRPVMNAQRRKKHQQGIRNLLDLAATHGEIARGSAEWTAQVHAAEWDADVNRMRAMVEKGSFPYTRSLLSGSLSRPVL